MIVNREKLLEKINAVFPFNQVADDQIALIADKSEVVFFKSGDMVFLEGAAAKYLYIIFEGEVEILKEKNQVLLKKNHLYTADLFGEDIFTEKRIRQTSARAIKDTLLIRISISIFSQLFQKNDRPRNLFKLTQNSYQLLVSNKRDLENDHETIHFIGQPHKLFLLIKAALNLTAVMVVGVSFYYLASRNIIPATVTRWVDIILIAFYLLWLAWNVYEWANDLYYFTDRRVINREQGLFLYENRDETPLDAIISLDSQMNIFGRQFGFGDLFIKTYTGFFRLKNVPFISETQKLLEYLIEKNSVNKLLNEKREFENLVRNRLGIKPEPSAEGEPDSAGGYQSENRPGLLSRLFSRLFGLKRYDGKSIIYRTHWILLVRKTIFPFLILLSLVLILLYLYTNAIDITHNQLIFAVFSILELSCVIWWLYQYMDWRNDQYIITPDQIIDLYRKPLGLEDKRTAPLENIQSIRYKREGLLGLMLNFGTVFIKVGNEDFTFDNVYNPYEIQQTLFGYLEQSNLTEKQTNLAEQQRQIADWMDTYQRLAKKNPEIDDELNK